MLRTTSLADVALLMGTVIQELYLNNNLFTGTLQPYWALTESLDKLYCYVLCQNLMIFDIHNTIDGAFLQACDEYVVGSPPAHQRRVQSADRVLALDGSVSRPIGSLHRRTPYSLSGSLPTDWSNLRVLEDLLLSENMLTGELPASWGGTEIIPSSLSQTLRRFRADRNLLTGTLPASWSTMNKLNELVLSDNGLTGTLPASWSSLGSLTELQVGGNTLAGTLPITEWSLGSLRNSLEQLNLTAAGITGTLSPVAQLLSRLQSFDWPKIVSMERSFLAVRYTASVDLLEMR